MQMIHFSTLGCIVKRNIIATTMYLHVIFIMSATEIVQKMKLQSSVSMVTR